MAFDKNNTSLGMKIIICFFAFSLVVSLCLPFFSGCSNTTPTGTPGAATTEEQQPYTVADVEAQYATLIESLQSKLAADANNTAAIASLGNTFMDYAMTMEGATDAADHEDAVQAAFDEAVKYYDLYLTVIPAGDANIAPVTVDRCVCLYYAGQAEKAVAELNAFLEGQPDYLMGWFNLGAMLYMDGSYEEAKVALNKVLELDPDATLTQTVYAQLYLSVIDSLLAAEAEEAAAAEGEEGTEGAEAAGTEGAEGEEPEGAEAAAADEPAEGEEAAGADEPAGDEADAE